MGKTRKKLAVPVRSPRAKPPAEALAAALGRAHAHQRDGRLREAEVECRELLRRAPDHPAALHLLGVITALQGDAASAARWIERSLELDPTDVPAYVNLAKVLRLLQRPADALKQLERALTLGRDVATVLLEHANTAAALGAYAQALASYERAISLDPGAVPAAIEAADRWCATGRYEEAEACYRKVSAAAPGRAEAWNGLGNALLELGRCEEALECYQRVCALLPASAEAYYNRSNALLDAGRLEEAVAGYEKALELRPGEARIHVNKGLCHLLLGDFERGWSDYDWRWQGMQERPMVPAGVPPWDGRPVDGTLLLWAEQGLGDQILHASMLSDVSLRAGRLIVAVEPRLVDLFARSFAGIGVVAQGSDACRGMSLQAYAPLGSVGRFVRRAESEFPVDRTAYLQADRERARRLRARMPQGLAIVGVSWKSSAAHVGAAKSIAPGELAAIARLPGLQLVDLQYGDSGIDRLQFEAIGAGLYHADDIDLTRDLDGVAALIAACDIVVTVSNTTAHLAAALGKPVHLLLARSRRALWYWHARRDDSPWYPSLRIYRQSEGGSWHEPVARVAQQLRAMLECTEARDGRRDIMT